MSRVFNTLVYVGGDGKVKFHTPLSSIYEHDLEVFMSWLKKDPYSILTVSDADTASKLAGKSWIPQKEEHLRQDIEAKIQAKFPQYVVEVRYAMNDASTFWAYVFNVPDNEINAVEDFIHNDCRDPSERHLILAFVKSEKVTSEHYPDKIKKLE